MRELRTNHICHGYNMTAEVTGGGKGLAWTTS